MTVDTSTPQTAPLRAVHQAKKHPVAAEAYKIAAIMVGAVVFAVGLEGFLVPNGFLDGGVVGVRRALLRRREGPGRVDDRRPRQPTCPRGRAHPLVRRRPRRGGVGRELHRFRMEEVSLVEDITAVDPDAHVTLSDITDQPGTPDLDLTVQRVSLRVAPLRLAAVATVPAVTIAVMTTPPNLASSAVPPYQASLLSTRDCTAT